MHNLGRFKACLRQLMSCSLRVHTLLVARGGAGLGHNSGDRLRTLSAVVSILMTAMPLQLFCCSFACKTHVGRPDFFLCVTENHLGATMHFPAKTGHTFAA